MITKTIYYVKHFGLISFLILPLFCISQRKYKVKNSINEDSVIKKWIHATINIEVKPTIRPMIGRYDELRAQGKIDRPTYERLIDSLEDHRKGYSGTAIFFKEKENYYLITARHVLVDNTNSKLNSIFESVVLIENPTTTRNLNGKWKVDKNKNVYANEGELAFLHNYPNYIFSSEANDIGILNLSAEQEGKYFVRTLLNRGYDAVTLKDIDSMCKLQMRDDILVFGFPPESLVGIINLPSTLNIYASKQVTVPIVTRGIIHSFNNKDNYFDARIFTYHGNSGGPVVKNNKLIGIVSGSNLDTVGLINSTKLLSGYAIYRSRFIKSSLILPLLRRLEAGELKE